MQIKNLLDKPLMTWGIYAPAKLKEMKAWLGNVGEEARKEEGHKTMYGDFNFVLDPKLDKIGGSEKSGMIGATEQKTWERYFRTSDM